MTNSKETRALAAFAAMSRIPDDYVLAAEQMLIEAEAGISRPPKPMGGFRRFLNSGWGAAVISGLVALAVLIFIIQAGVNPPGVNPPPTPPAGSTIEMSNEGVNYILSTELENYPEGTDCIAAVITGKNPGETVYQPAAWKLERLTASGVSPVGLSYTEEAGYQDPRADQYAQFTKKLYPTEPLTAGTYRLHATKYDGEKYVSVAWCEFTVGESEAETVDKYGFYEGNEVIFNGMYDLTFFEDDPLFTDGDAIAIFGVSSFTKKETVVLSDVVPASRHIGDLGFMDPFTIHYKASVRNVETGEILYHTYANGYNEFDYSPDGRLLEFRDPADSESPLPHEEAIALSKQFLEAVGIELTDDYVPYARDGCGCYCCGQQSEFTFVYWTREIGGVAAEGYLVLCGDGGRVKLCVPVNTGMYETYGYITQEQVDHTRARLLEALSRTEDYYGDPYEVVEGHERGRLFLGNDGNLYLGIHISAAITDLHGNPGYLCMRINP